MTGSVCKICGSTRTYKRLVGKDRLHHLPGLFEIWRCRNCSLLFLNPCPDQGALDRFYPETYYSYSNSDKAVTQPLSRRQKALLYLKNPLKALNALVYSKWLGQNRDVKVCAEMRVLDIGCGDGRYLLEKRQNGAQCYGVDINVKALAALQKMAPDIQVYCGDLWDAQWQEESFDVVNLCHVMEHVKDIDKLLLEIRRLLKPEGLLRIQVPNAASLTAKLFGKFWFSLETPRHLYIFSRNNLFRYLKLNGFEITGSRTLENSFDVISSLIYVWSALFRKRYEEAAMEKCWDNEWAKLLLTPYALTVNVLGVGSVMEFVVRKTAKT